MIGKQTTELLELVCSKLIQIPTDQTNIKKTDTFMINKQSSIAFGGLQSTSEYTPNNYISK